MTTMGDAMCLQGHIEVVNDMLAAGVKATKSVLVEAVGRGDIELVKLFLVIEINPHPSMQMQRQHGPNQM